MPQSINNIHDKFVKQLLSNQDVATEFLQTYLPVEVVNNLDFSTMAYESTSYLSEELRASYADMVWRISTKNNEATNVCLLLEHKSYANPNVAFQILEYIALGYQNQLKNKQDLALIIPILYYHGEKKFEFKSIQQYFSDLSTAFRAYVPVYDTEFINLKTLGQAQILSLRNGMLRASLLLQQNYADPKRLSNSLKNILESLNQYSDLNTITFIFVYMLSNKRLRKQEIQQAIAILPPPISDTVMSIYEELIQEGLEKGITKGREIGIEEGIEKGIEKTILNGFDNGFDLNTIRVISGENLEKIEAILKKNGRG